MHCNINGYLPSRSEPAAEAALLQSIQTRVAAQAYLGESPLLPVGYSKPLHTFEAGQSMQQLSLSSRSDR